jgi:hypothetical protein
MTITMLRTGLSAAVGVIGVVWLLLAVVGPDSHPSESLRRRRFRAASGLVVFICFGLMVWNRFGEVARGVWWFSLVGVLSGLLGSLLLFRTPRNADEPSQGT